MLKLDILQTTLQQQLLDGNHTDEWKQTVATLMEDESIKALVHEKLMELLNVPSLHGVKNLAQDILNTDKQEFKMNLTTAEKFEISVSKHSACILKISR